MYEYYCSNTIVDHSQWKYLFIFNQTVKLNMNMPVMFCCEPSNTHQLYNTCKEINMAAVLHFMLQVHKWNMEMQK